VDVHGPVAGASDASTSPAASWLAAMHTAVPAQAIGITKSSVTFVFVHAAAPPAGFDVVNRRPFGSPAMQSDAVGQRTLKKLDSPKLSSVHAPPSGLVETA
jgi:hypothetical protein